MAPRPSISRPRDQIVEKSSARPYRRSAHLLRRFALSHSRPRTTARPFSSSEGTEDDVVDHRSKASISRRLKQAGIRAPGGRCRRAALWIGDPIDEAGSHSGFSRSAAAAFFAGSVVDGVSMRNRAVWILSVSLRLFACRKGGKQALHTDVLDPGQMEAQGTFRSTRSSNVRSPRVGIQAHVARHGFTGRGLSDGFQLDAAIPYFSSMIEINTVNGLPPPAINPASGIWTSD